MSKIDKYIESASEHFCFNNPLSNENKIEIAKMYQLEDYSNAIKKHFVSLLIGLIIGNILLWIA